MNWKILSLTLVISMILFFGIVSMGMKYDWIDKFNSSDKQEVVLEIPQQTETYWVDDAHKLPIQSNYTLDFQPVVLKHDKNNLSVFSSMTKQQVIDYCTAQFQKSKQPNQQMALAIGDCVVTRYQDPYQKMND